MKGIIFDLDGTLIDLLEAIALTMNDALSQFNLETHMAIHILICNTLLTLMQITVQLIINYESYCYL